MKLLVTGGAGFIGSNFIIYWLKKYPQDKIINLDLLTYAGNLDNLKTVKDNPNYFFVKGDIVDKKLVEEAIKGVDVVVHFAAESHVDRSILDSEIFVKTNILGTQVLLESALKHKIKHFHNVSCYDEKTRAYTKDGFKRFDEIKKGDKVLSLNIKTKTLEWKPVEKVIVQNYKGEMIKIKSKTVDFFVTPNHRMLCQTKTGKKLIFKSAEMIKEQSINKLPKHYKWRGKISKIFNGNINNKDFMYILGIFVGDGFVAYQEKKLINKTGLNKVEYLKESRDSLGRFVRLGKVGARKNIICKSWRIFLDIPEKDSCRKRCEQALDNLGIKWSAHKGRAGEHLYFNSKKYCKIFEQCGKGAKNKKIPQWALQAPKEMLRPFWEGLMDSDGSERRIFYTSSKNLAQQFIELSTKLGFSCSLNTRYSTSKINKREVKGFSYFVSLGREWRSMRKEICRTRKYKGNIWCLKVKDNKNFLMERNGKIAFCGNTDEVFGSLELGSTDKFSEESCFSPNSPYSASKAGADCLVRAYFKTYNLPVTITNTSNNFGPYQFPEKFIPQTITNLLEDKKVPIYGNGQQLRDWLYVEDHCRAIDLVLQKGKMGQTYLIGGLTQDISNLEVAKKICQILGKSEELLDFVKDRPGHDIRYAIDWSKAKKTLGYKPLYDFDNYLDKTIYWYKDNIKWWQRVKSGEYQKFYKKWYK